MLKTISIIVGILIVAAVVTILILAALKPDTFRVERSATIDAAPDKIYPLINDFHAFGTWSPYEKLDPAMKRSYEGPASGVGAAYAWEGNGNAGIGRMEIVESIPNEKISINLDFKKPFEAHNIVEFTLVPQGDATTVTWSMHGPVYFQHKIMHVIFNMDKMVGDQMTEGLANLKAIAEK